MVEVWAYSCKPSLDLSDSSNKVLETPWKAAASKIGRLKPGAAQSDPILATNGTCRVAQGQKFPIQFT